MEEKEKKELGKLILRLADGDAQALNGIAHKVENLLMSVGWLYYKNHADVEDAVHDLYLKLYYKASRFKENTNALSWIVRVFENSIKSHLRHLQIEEEYIQREISHLSSNVNIVDASYIDNHLYLQEVIDQLTNEDKKIVIYYYWCKCTVREVAQIMHKPSSTIHRKIKKLEEKVKNL